MTVITNSPEASGIMPSFYAPGVHARVVTPGEEAYPEQIGLLPLGDEARFTSQQIIADTAMAVQHVADFYARYTERLRPDAFPFAQLGRTGIRIAYHTVPHEYAVLAFEEQSIIRCVIDDLTLGVRYFERHKREPISQLIGSHPNHNEHKPPVYPFQKADIQAVKATGVRAKHVLDIAA